MNDTIITINVGVSPAPTRSPITLTLPEFIRGYESGKREFVQGDDAGHILTDEEVLEAIRTAVQDGAMEDASMLEYAIGSLLGWMSGNH